MHLRRSSLCSEQTHAPEAQLYLPNCGSLKKRLLSTMPQNKASGQTGDLKPCLQPSLTALYPSGEPGKEELALITGVKHPQNCSTATPQDESPPTAAVPEPPAKPLG